MPSPYTISRIPSVVILLRVRGDRISVWAGLAGSEYFDKRMFETLGYREHELNHMVTIEQTVRNHSSWVGKANLLILAEPDHAVELQTLSPSRFTSAMDFPLVLFGDRDLHDCKATIANANIYTIA